MADVFDTLQVRHKIRADVASVWQANNPVLLENELAIELGTSPELNKVKVGDGVTAWNDLGYTYDLASIVAKIPAENSLYQLTKESADISDASVLETVTDAKNGDVAVITTTKDDVVYDVSSYIYNEVVGDFVAITGNVDASKVILRDDITMAGSYTAVGNLTKEETGRAIFATSGKSLTEVLTEIFTKREQPTITAPSVGTFTLASAGIKEAGTTITSTSFSGASFNPGSYTYGPATGCTVTSTSVDRVAVPTTLSATGIATASSGTDTNDGAGFIIGDQGGDNVVSSLKYTCTVNYSAGAVANDNLGEASNPTVQIEAGSVSATTSAMTPFRKYFYGAVSTETPKEGSDIDSALVRSLTGSTVAYSAKSVSYTVPAGSTGVYVACIADKTGVTKVINTSALNADVTDTFTKQTGVAVEGANGYTAVDYNVWYYIPAVAYENAATLTITLG